MTASARISDKKPRRVSAASQPERSVAAHLATMLRPTGAKPERAVHIVDSDGQRIDLPVALADVMARAASLLAEGHNVSVFADDEMLTTQAAADRLNVSRQYLVRLVDRGELPSVKVGSHRRIRASDVGTYKAQRDGKRDAMLDRLTALSEEMDGYSLEN